MEVRVLTWNLNGLDDTSIDDRTEAALFIALSGSTLAEIQAGASPASPPDVMCMQEVTSRMFHAHIRPHLIAMGYVLLPMAPPDRQCFEVIAIRAPWVVREYVAEPLAQSVYGRVLHRVDLATESPLAPSAPTLRVLTGHLDSGKGKRETGVRIAQINQIAARLVPNGVFGGDANLRSAEWAALRGQVTMSDAWETLGSPDDGRVTWSADGMNARFDRIFHGAQVRPIVLQTIGSHPLDGVGRTVSDHLGIVLHAEVVAAL